MQISVALTTYNGSQFIEPQLDSILEQSRQPDEIVICDDNSSDGTYDILQPYRDENPDLIEIHQNETNVGVRQNFAQCIDRCNGDWIVLSDQDDVWKRTKIEQQCEVSKSTNYSLIFHNSQIVTEDLSPITDHWSEIGYEYNNTRDPMEQIRRLVVRNFVKGSTVMFDASLINDVLPIPEGWMHDYYIALWAAVRKGLYGINKPLHLYRRHANQASDWVTDSFLEKVYRGVFDGLAYQELSSRAKKWRLLYQQFEQVPRSKLNIDKNELLELIESRKEYEMNRRIIYSCDKGFVEGLRSLSNNILTGRYSQFGDVSTSAYIGKDLLACFLSKYRSWIA